MTLPPDAHLEKLMPECQKCGMGMLVATKEQFAARICGSCERSSTPRAGTAPHEHRFNDIGSCVICGIAALYRCSTHGYAYDESCCGEDWRQAHLPSRSSSTPPSPHDTHDWPGEGGMRVGIPKCKRCGLTKGSLAATRTPCTASSPPPPSTPMSELDKELEADKRRTLVGYERQSDIDARSVRMGITEEELTRWESQIEKFPSNSRDTILRLVRAVRASPPATPSSPERTTTNSTCAEQPYSVGDVRDIKGDSIGNFEWDSGAEVPSPPAELTEALDRLESSAFDNGMLTERHGKIPRNVELGEQTAAAHSVICALFDGQREEIKALEKETAMYVASLSSQLERLKAEQTTPEEARWLLEKAHIVLVHRDLAAKLRRRLSSDSETGDTK